MLPTFFIVNPQSGNGNVSRTIPLIRQHFDGTGIPYEIYLTKKSSDATIVAREVSDRFPVLVAVGGGRNGQRVGQWDGIFEHLRCSTDGVRKRFLQNAAASS